MNMYTIFVIVLLFRYTKIRILVFLFLSSSSSHVQHRTCQNGVRHMQTDKRSKNNNIQISLIHYKCKQYANLTKTHPDQ